MKLCERGLRFDCQGDSLIGVLSESARNRQDAGDLGVLIAVGGPQYRAGSHRQFVLLARRLATAGYPVLRFDVRGMGDSTGEFPGFEALGPDLEAASLALQGAVPALRRLVLWGLCDAASAALLHASAMPALAGLVLLNPWVRHESTHTRTQLRHYYATRLFDRAFWRKLVAGHVRVAEAMGELVAKVWSVFRAHVHPESGAGVLAAGIPVDYREIMAQGALAFRGPQLYILSGRDLVSAEFIDYAASHPGLAGLWSRPGVERLDLAAADHTFSSRALGTVVEDATLAFLAQLAASPGYRRA